MKRLHVFVVDAGIADVREGERHDLAGVGRIGQDLLVSGHRGVEAELSGHLPLQADPLSTKYPAVRQNENARVPGRSTLHLLYLLHLEHCGGVDCMNRAGRRDGVTFIVETAYMLQKGPERAAQIARLVEFHVGHVAQIVQIAESAWS